MKKSDNEINKNSIDIVETIEQSEEIVKKAKDYSENKKQKLNFDIPFEETETFKLFEKETNQKEVNLNLNALNI